MKLKIILASAIVALGIVGGYVFPVAKNLSLGQALPQAVAVFETSLASPISTSATSMTLTANSVRGGSTLSGFNCFTVDEGSAQAEFICGTVSGTTVSGLTRGVDPATGTSTVASLQFAHRRGANVKITDFPVITILRNQNNGIESYPNVLHYANTVVNADITSATTSLVSYQLLSDSLAAGTVDGSTLVKGVFEGATALEQASSTAIGSTLANLVMLSANATDTPLSGCASGFTSTAGAGCSVIATLAGKIKQTWLDIFTTQNTWGGTQIYGATTTATSSKAVFGFGDFAQVYAGTTLTGNTTPQPVYASSTDNEYYLSDANVTEASRFVGFAVLNGSDGATTTVQFSGVVEGFSGLTRGAKYYVQDAVGTIGTTMGTYEVLVGEAISGTQILITRNDQWEYVGSGTCSLTLGNCDIAGPSIARFARVERIAGDSSACSGPRAGEVTITQTVFKKGNSTVTDRAAFLCTDAAGSHTGAGATFTAVFTSTSSVRLSQTIISPGTESGGTQTAYFYR